MSILQLVRLRPKLKQVGGRRIRVDGSRRFRYLISKFRNKHVTFVFDHCFKYSGSVLPIGTTNTSSLSSTAFVTMHLYHVSVTMSSVRHHLRDLHHLIIVGGPYARYRFQGNCTIVRHVAFLGGRGYLLCGQLPMRGGGCRGGSLYSRATSLVGVTYPRAFVPFYDSRASSGSLCESSSFSTTSVST